ncbi:MAG: peptide chain release factor N(5)-glutamine methyltransferase [Chloroflexota bacterium]
MLPVSCETRLTPLSLSMIETRRHMARTLDSAGIPDHSLEADILLCHVTGGSRLLLHLEPSRRLRYEESEVLCRLLSRRLTREPLAYVLASSEFYGLEFYVDHRVFIPRPETELLVEKALEGARCLARHANHPLVIADIGTGCGCVAIALALSLPHAHIYAVDISAGALEVADINRRKHAVADRVQLLQGDLTHPLPEPADLLVANLPYVEHDQVANLSPEIRYFEPVTALDGGNDGLEYIRRLLKDAPSALRHRAIILLEVGVNQAPAVMQLASEVLETSRCTSHRDLSGIQRVVSIERGMPQNSNATDLIRAAGGKS